jgi:hypothetical protein
MKTIGSAVLLSVSLAYASHANAVLLSGFEDDLTGWDSIGDVTVQGSVIGNPSQGKKQALITTMCDGRIVGWCNGDVSEPYSGNSSVPATSFLPGNPSAAAFLGLPTGESEFEAILPELPANGPVGETGAIKTRFFATA